MKRLLQSLIIATGVVAISGAAMAADIIRPPPAAKPVVVVTRAYDWSGHYIGIQGGWDRNHATTSAGGGATADINGGLFGIYGGWNFQHAGNFVFGIDASINWDNASGNVNGFPGYHGEVDWKAFLRARAGIALDRVLLYATGGATWADLKLVGPGCGTCGNPMATGWTAGAGAEFAVHNNWTMRLDWAYSKYGNFHYTQPIPFTATMASNTFTVGLAAKF